MMKHYLRFSYQAICTFSLLLLTSSATAESVIVRNATLLWENPSLQSRIVLPLLPPHTKLHLLTIENFAGFFHVETLDGHAGWVSKSDVIPQELYEPHNEEFVLHVAGPPPLATNILCSGLYAAIQFEGKKNSLNLAPNIFSANTNCSDLWDIFLDKSTRLSFEPLYSATSLRAYQQVDPYSSREEYRSSYFAERLREDHDRIVALLKSNVPLLVRVPRDREDAIAYGYRCTASLDQQFAPKYENCSFLAFSTDNFLAERAIFRDIRDISIFEIRVTRLPPDQMREPSAKEIEETPVYLRASLQQIENALEIQIQSLVPQPSPASFYGFQRKSAGAFNTLDVNSILDETRKSLNTALSKLNLLGMKRYVASTFPPAFEINKSGTKLTNEAVQSAVASVRMVLRKLWATSYNIVAEIEVNSSPSGAACAIWPATNAVRYAYTNGKITNIFRGWYDFKMTKPGLKDGSGKTIDLIDQDVRQIHCVLYVESESHPSQCAFQ